jgi:flagellar hook assembly protein FlgD
VLYTYKISDIEENTNIETFHPAITVMADGNIINHKDIPKVFALHTNYPNPFNPETTIEFDLPKDASLQLKIYDVTGKLVRTYADGERWDAGYHSVVWDGKDERGKSLSSGMYFYRMITDEFNQTKQMLLLK